MKKVLFATTALVATAGIASADVAISGYAEMGVTGGSGTTVTQFLQDVDVRFTLSGETDSGITFGAGVDLDENAGGVGRDDAGATVFISGDFGTLTLGDTDGGYDAGMQEVNIGSPGSIADNETGHAGYTGNNGLDGLYDGQVLSYSYSVSGFTITGSVEMDDDGGAAGTATATFAAGGVSLPFNTPDYANGGADRISGDGLTGDAIYGIGGAYAGSFGGGSYTVGAGYQTVNDVDAINPGAQGYTITGVSATVALDMGLSAGISYSVVDVSGMGAAALSFSGTHIAIGASYAFDDITVHANYGVWDYDVTSYVADTSGWALAAGYNLGGGLNALLGYQSSTVDAVNATALGAGAVAATLGTTSTWSLGLAMSF